MAKSQYPTIKSGDIFGRWTIIQIGVGRSSSRGLIHLCRCTCGTEKPVQQQLLRNGNSKSCGCYQREFATAQKQTHVLHKSPENGIWRNIKARCLNPRKDAFPYYGGRGITMCTRWQESFLAFYEDMGPRPSPQHTIERIDNNWGYFPANCEWRTRIDQAKNTRQNWLFLYQEKTFTVGQLAHHLSLNENTVRGRLRRDKPFYVVFAVGEGEVVLLHPPLKQISTE